VTARSALAWVLVAPWTVWAAWRLLGLGGGYPVVAVLSVTPLAAPGAALALVAALLLRRRAPAALAALSLAALASSVAPRAIDDGERAPAGARPLRVLSLNLLGTGARPAEVVALVRRTRVDVLSLQELRPESVTRLEAAGLRRALPGRVLRPRPGAAGNGLYSRFPLRAIRPPSDTYFAMAAARIRAPGAVAVEVVAVHARAPTGSEAIDDWRDDLDKLPGAPGSGPLRVLAGDFNATLDHRELRRLLDRGYDDAAEGAGAGLRTTWPSGRRLPPLIAIDHVLLDRRAAVGDVSVHEVPGTDHRGVLAEVLLPPG
jgi:endonuclease/exonuclease/phosphatase (EEP) superfamily protein YafD